MTRISLLVAICFPAIPAAQGPTADALMAALDQNMVFDTRVARVKMIIHKDGKETEKELRMQSRGHETAFTEFLAPPRDKGTKYLKLERNLWMWLPGAEKQVKISGHMLRQSLMGSDFSYEDMLEAPDMSGRYDATLEGEQELDGRTCHVLVLKAKKPETTYPQRKVWLDKERSVPVKQELYALTGKVMKEERFFDVKEFPAPAGGKRVYPTRIQMRNLLQQGTYTEIQLHDVTFGGAIADDVFTLGNLGKGN